LGFKATYFFTSQLGLNPSCRTLLLSESVYFLPVCIIYSIVITMESYKVSGHTLLDCKNRLMIFPSPAGISPKSPWQGIIKLFPARESLVSDIPARDGKIDNLFYSVSRIPYKHP
jgi:hypothetical protein